MSYFSIDWGQLVILGGSMTFFGWGMYRRGYERGRARGDIEGWDRCYRKLDEIWIQPTLRKYQEQKEARRRGQ